MSLTYSKNILYTRFKNEKSRKQETLNLSTDAVSITIAMKRKKT